MAQEIPKTIPPLFSHQREIIKWGITNRSGLILADLGSGKTRSMLEIIRVRRSVRGPGKVKRVLIMSSKDILEDTWPKAISEWTPELRYTSLVGLTPNKRDDAFYMGTDIHLLNIEMLKWLVDKLKNIPELPYDMIVLDESTLIKNTVNSKRWKMIKPLAERFWNEGKYIYGMTAKPTPNELVNIFPQVVFVRPDGKTFGTTFPTHFKSTYCKPHPRIPFKYVFDPSYEKFLYNKLSEVSIRIKLDKNHTPGHTKNYIDVTLPDSAMKLYKKMEKDFFLEIGDSRIHAGMAAAKMSKLWQISNGAVYDEDNNTIELHEAKLDKLESIYEGLNGGSLLVGYWFQSDLQMIKKRFKVPKYEDHGIEFIESGTENVPDIVTKFNDGRCRLLIGQMSKIARGLNLQHNCNHLCLYSMLWDLDIYDQLIGRLDRTGQKYHVFVHHLLGKGTLDGGIAARLGSKAKKQSDLLEFLYEKQKEI